MNVYDLFEWAWTVSSAAGVIGLGYLVKDAFEDRRATIEAVTLNGRRGIYASLILRLFLLFFFMQTVNLILGIAAILTPNPTDPQNIRAVFALAATVFNLLMDGVVALTIYDRRRIRNYPARSE